MNLFEFFSPKTHKVILLFAALTVVAVQVSAQELSHFYPKGTLLIPVSGDEIMKVPVWQSPGVAYDQFMGVKAISNRYRGQYQCTELAHRFIHDLLGVPTRVGNGLGNANVLVQNLYSRFGTRTYSYKDKQVRLNFIHSKDEPPAPGSLINFEIGKFGHIAVVRYVEVLNENQLRVYLIEQHGFPKWSRR
jgi:hypothetical protein